MYDALPRAERDSTRNSYIHRLYGRRSGEDRNRRPLPFTGGYHVNHCTYHKLDKYRFRPSFPEENNDGVISPEEGTR
jgi:hypothetical protein